MPSADAVDAPPRGGAVAAAGLWPALTATIRASVADVEFTMLLTIVLVVAVIFVFLRSVRATVIPDVTVPLALIGTLALMYVFG